MKGKPNEWIVLADLMSGVVAIVIVLLTVALAQRQVAVLPQAQAKAAPSEVAKKPEEVVQREVVQRAQEQQQQRVTAVLGQMESAFAQQGASSYVAIDAETGKVTLKERAFRSGSACIEPEAKAAFAKVEGQIAEYLQQFQSGRIYVEGHTDDKPVKAPVTDYRSFCTVYDDNFTLSAARAREARLLLIGRAGSEASKRVIVAGYGDSQPLPGIDPRDERNRRVELRFVNGGERR
ncbi:flagellar motor protein MotB [Herbaspirillum sp. alder98]|uniref:OmpA/MotB family protein n=1 Tax=Herbaspirillum sp. alder98 TaxID=2913096 RepID=UPI001CD87A9D|nr:OmpA family protein [Herbaspirillum sp. alder98]MCA1324211.1 OmpA family protein [Herbaspirillum sp. alder98]